MFSFFTKDPIKKLQVELKNRLEEAMHIQRLGDLRHYASKMELIDKLEKEIETLQAAKR